MSISQELFDETVLENEEVFELSPEEALIETISQFRQQNIDVTKAGILTSHPSLEKGKKERAQQSNFLSNLNFLDKFILEDGTIQNHDGENETTILNALKGIQTVFTGTNVEESSDVQMEPSDDMISNVYMHTLVRSEGIFTLLSLLSSTSLPILHESASCMLSILTTTSSSPMSLEFKRQIQLVISPVLPRLVKLIESHSKEDFIFLRLAMYASRGCQQNKVGIVRAGKAFPILLNMLSIKVPENEENYIPSNDDLLLWTYTCQLLTSVCQFDDNTATASTAHDFAQDLFRHDSIPILHKLLSLPIAISYESETIHSKLKCAIMSVQRVLAVNDEIVQALVAQGVLKTTSEALSQTLEHSEGTTSNPTQTTDIAISTASAALGLLRNLCGNDDIKTTLCQNSLSSILSSMSQFIQSPKVQEHGLAILAAMSLRRTSNANLLLQNNVLDIVQRSMQKFPDDEKIQRAGCLCIRNAIARQSDEIKNGIKEDYPLLEKVLRDAGKFRGTVDEAYAALRDLDIRVEMIRLEEIEETDENGVSKKNVVVKKSGVEMFGENKLKFKQTWDESEDVEERIEGLF